jgi:hypothetical protein
MQRLFAAVLAVTCVVGSTPSFAQAGIASGIGRGGPTTLLRAPAPRVPSSENRSLGAPVSQLPAFDNRILGAQTPQAPARENRIQGAPLPQVPGSENRIVGVPLPPAAQSPIVSGPVSQSSP